VSDPRDLTPEELVEAWRAHGLVNARYDALEKLMVQKLEDGKSLPGVKLVEARTHRRWINAALVVDELLLATDLSREKLFDEPSLISPAKVEKLLPKAQRGIVKSLAEKPRGGPCIADEGDSRPDYDSVAQARVDAVFDDLDDPFA
jgi:hypothetical protein